MDESRPVELINSIKLNGEYTDITPAQLIEAGLTIQELVERVQKTADDIGVHLDVNYYVYYVDTLPYLYQLRCKIDFNMLPVITWPKDFVWHDV